jgi:hypothetical protein
LDAFEHVLDALSLWVKNMEDVLSLFCPASDEETDRQPFRFVSKCTACGPSGVQFPGSGDPNCVVSVLRLAPVLEILAACLNFGESCLVKLIYAYAAYSRSYLSHSFGRLLEPNETQVGAQE